MKDSSETFNGAVTISLGPQTGLNLGLLSGIPSNNYTASKSKT